MSEAIAQQIRRLRQSRDELYQVGQFEQALPLAREVCTLVRQSAGEHHPDYAASLESLALLYRDMGNHGAALPLAQHALEVIHAALGETHPDFARSLNCLALLYSAMGDHAAALPLLQQALEVRRAAWGEDHPEFAQSHNNLLTLYFAMGDHAAALPLLQQALEVARAAWGEDHPNFAKTLSSLGGMYHSMGEYAAALPLYRQALEVRRAALGEAHPDFAFNLGTLAQLYEDMGDLAAALPLARQALEVTRAARGEDHPEFATSLNYLAALYSYMGEYAAALPLARQALEVTRAARGEDYPEFATSLNNLAMLYRAMGEHAAALPLLQQALAVTRAARGEAHPEFAWCLNNLGALYYSMGEHAAALPVYRQALEVRRAALGETHPEFARTLNNLATVYSDMGEYAAALPLAVQALEVRRAALGEAHPDFAFNLGTLARLYEDMGEHAAALPLARQALEVTRTALGEAHPDFARSLNNLGALYSSMGEHAAALPLLQQALAVTHAALGEAHPDFAESLKNLAWVYHNMGEHAAALPLLRQALEVRRAALGEAHPEFASSLNNLALLYRDMGEHAAALPLARQALEVTRAALGETHPHIATGLKNLALLYAAMDQPLEALPLLEQAAGVHDWMIGQVFSVGSERQRIGFLNKLHFNLDIFLSLVWQALASSREAVGAALDLVLRRKAVGAEALAAQRDAVLGNKYPTLRPRFQQWAALRMQIARKTLAGPGPDGAQAHWQLLDQWQAEKEGLEADLARQVPEMNLERKLRAADRRAVALALPAGAALVEFVRYHPYNFKAVPARGEQRWQPARYLAFVLPAGAPGRVRLLDLGEAEPIDRLIADFRAGVMGGAELRDLSREPTRPRAAAGATPGERLRATVFDPLAEALGECRRLLLSPDGDLNRLPFEALPLAEGSYLLDEYRISYVSAGRDVLRFGAGSGRRPAEPVVAADPDFDLAVGGDTARPERQGAAQPAPRRGFWARLFGRRPAAPAPEPAVRPAPAAQAPARLSRDLNRGRYHFPRLPGTRAEGERVGRRLGVKPLLAGAALEGRLKACRSPRILHLATHGFFLPDQQPHLPDFPGRNLELGGGADAAAMGRLSGPGMENPMLRSGLALAGANTFLRHQALPDEAEDGLLTAEDVAGLDLLDTELVVLSACETGLGALHIGEGVLGLRRAFGVAGAKALVMSLWKVPDLATAFLMDRLYDNLLAGGLDRDLALRQAQRATREVTVGELRGDWLSGEMMDQLAGGDPGARDALEELAQQPDEHRPFAHPFYWGAFICQGDTAPLRPGPG
jgi:tetratricopeptide (TPR) repeat protein/CHAT domain-containing protein